MNTLVCELCNSSDFIKHDGLFVCQNCGTKYTVEEARNIIFGTNAPQPQPVAPQPEAAPYANPYAAPYSNPYANPYAAPAPMINQANELENLFKAARNARETGDIQSALRHYERITVIAPDAWEALFFLVILRTNEIKNSQIHSSAVNVINCLPKVFNLINTSIADEAEKKEAIWTVIQQCQDTATWLTAASHNFYRTTTKGDGLIALTGLFGAISSAGSVLTALSEDNTRCVAAANIMVTCGNIISSTFSMEDNDFRNHAVWSWQQAMNFHNEYPLVHKTQTLFNENYVRTIADNINRFAPQTMNPPVAPQYGAPAPQYTPPQGVAPQYAAPVQQYTPQQPTASPVLTINFNANAGSIGQLWYSIDNGEKMIANRGEKKTHFVSEGTHTLSILNPFYKKDHNFIMDRSKTLNFYGKSFTIDITESL